ncbi:branched-chain amino acid ABC transporter permease [Rhizobium cremeum]|uniref:branched-chain amino acid ABC transporter permease n=1 Tax=Rhizobium cremeum TaxID=2813827 RepID=UPI0039E1F545
MSYLLQQLVNAVPIAALYAALAFGYALAFGMTRRPDITYGALFAFAGQVFLLFAHIGWNRLFLVLPATLALASAASLVYTATVGSGIARHVLRPLHNASTNAVIVASLALVLLLSEFMRLSMNSRELWLSPFLNGRIVFWRQDGFEVGLTVIQLGSAAFMAGLVAVGHAVLTRSRLGRAWRAVADDPRAARLCGVDADGVFVLSYVSAASIAAICGILATSYYGSMDFASGLLFGLKIVLIAAVGGYSVPLKSALGAALVGLAETLWGGYAPLLWRDAAIISALVLLLVASRRERPLP